MRSPRSYTVAGFLVAAALIVMVIVILAT